MGQGSGHAIEDVGRRTRTRPTSPCSCRRAARRTRCFASRSVGPLATNPHDRGKVAQHGLPLVRLLDAPCRRTPHRAGRCTRQSHLSNLPSALRLDYAPRSPLSQPSERRGCRSSSSSVSDRRRVGTYRPPGLRIEEMQRTGVTASSIVSPSRARLRLPTRATNVDVGSRWCVAPHWPRGVHEGDRLLPLLRGSVCTSPAR
jgi:hypothetical protein